MSGTLPPGYVTRTEAPAELRAAAEAAARAAAAALDAAMSEAHAEAEEESAATNGGKAGVNSKLKAGKRTSRYGVHCTDCRCSDAALTLKAHELCQTMLAIIQRSKKLDPDLTCVDANRSGKKMFSIMFRF